jgi:hypothetical protein
MRPSERYNQIVRRTVYIVEIVLQSKNGRHITKEEGCSQAIKPISFGQYARTQLLVFSQISDIFDKFKFR